ncbi:hypothetical protein KIPB_004051 [Kipferlia bialata]|uniref:Uncharacterized protein n=1 Tax=Kipferlia bialata TaxID=797122 RepID=A0A9K3CUQ4_9EUKA|nr:hypothetical protein KIPB_002172 [Kipferlia bialata]GIQ82837.1 hypothetical protein KIPB_004051 [Kipferlia bialata]|eukprot:g2172.t1
MLMRIVPLLALLLAFLSLVEQAVCAVDPANILDVKGFTQPGTAAESGFGQAMDVEGSWMALGSVLPGDEKVVMYKENASGGWDLHSTLTRPDSVCVSSDAAACASVDVGFGTDVAISGDRMAIGATEAWSIHQSKSMGSVLIYEYSADAWTFQYELKSPNCEDISLCAGGVTPFGGFGSRVALSPGIAATCIYNDNDSTLDGLWFSYYTEGSGYGPFHLWLNDGSNVNAFAIENNWFVLMMHSGAGTYISDMTDSEYIADNPSSMVPALQQLNGEVAYDCAFDWTSGDSGIVAFGVTSTLVDSALDVGSVTVYALDSSTMQWEEEANLIDPASVENDGLGTRVAAGYGVVAATNKMSGATYAAVWTRDSGVASDPWGTTIRQAIPAYAEATGFASGLFINSATSLMVGSEDAPLVTAGVAVPSTANVGGVYRYSLLPPVSIEAVLPTLTLDSTCGTQTLVFTLEEDDATITVDHTSDITLGWGTVDNTLIPTWNSGDNTYTVDITAPSTAGDSTFTVWLENDIVGTAVATLAQQLNTAKTIATWVLPTHSTLGDPDGIDLSGDFVFTCLPKDDCNNNIPGTVLDFSQCDADNSCLPADALTEEYGWSVELYLVNEGVYTYTLSEGGTDIHSDTIDIAPVFVTVGSDAVGVSSTHSTLTGLPTGTEEAYTVVLTLKDVAGVTITSDISPVLEWDGVARTLTWDGTSHTYSLSGTEGVATVSLDVTVSVGAVEVLSESVSTSEVITCTDLTLPITGTCQSGTGTFSLLKNGAAYTTDRSSLLTATWEDATVVPVVYAAGTYTLAISLSAPGAHTLTLKLDGTPIATQTVTLVSVIRDTYTYVIMDPSRAVVDEAVTLTVHPMDLCNVAMTGPLTLDVALSLNGVVAEQDTVSESGSYAMTTSLGMEGVYTVTVREGVQEVKTDSLECASVYGSLDGGMGRVGVSTVHSTLTGLPNQVNTDYTASLVLEDITDTVIDRDLSVDDVVSVSYAGVAGTVAWDSTTNSYTVTGNSGTSSGTLSMVASVNGITVVTETTSIRRSRRAVYIAAAAVGATAVGAVSTVSVVKAKAKTKNKSKIDLEEGVLLDQGPIMSVPASGLE